MRRGAVFLLVSVCLVGPCAVACTASDSSPEPAPIPSGPVPTVQQLVGAYASTLAHERFRFDSKFGDAEYIGTLDLAHGGLDLSTPGTGQLEVRYLGSHEWVRNAIATADPQIDALLSGPTGVTSAFPSPEGFASPEVDRPQDSQTWVIAPATRGDIQSEIAEEIPSAAILTGLDRSGTSAVQKLAATNVRGASTVGYQWSATLPAAVDSLAKVARGTEVQIQLRLDSQGRVTQLRISLIPVSASSSATAADQSAAPRL